MTTDNPRYNPQAQDENQDHSSNPEYQVSTDYNQPSDQKENEEGTTDQTSQDDGRSGQTQSNVHKENGQTGLNPGSLKRAPLHIKVQIMDVNKTVVCDMFVKALKTTIENHTDGNNVYKVIENHDEEDAEARLLVICPLQFRLKTDIDIAISSVKRKGDYAVVIFHTVKEDKLPMVPSQDKLTGYNNISIIDMGFNIISTYWSVYKIYKCDTNKEAKLKLFRYIDNVEAPCAKK